MKDCLAQCSLAKAQSRQDGPEPFSAELCPMLGVPPFPGEIVPMAHCSHCQPLSSGVQLGSSPGVICTHFPLFFPCDSLQSLHFLCSHPSNPGTQCQVPQAFLLGAHLTQVHQPFFPWQLPCAGSSLWPFWTFSSLSRCSLCSGEHWTQYSRYRLTDAE